MLSSKDTLVDDIKDNQLATYERFYRNQYNVSDNAAIIFQIVSDIEKRLAEGSVLHLPKFVKMRLLLEKIKKSGQSMLDDFKSELDKISPQQLNSFVISYIEAIYELLKVHDPSINGTYYTQFAKDFMKEIYKTGTNTRVYFTFKDLEYDLSYFINVRPTCFYPVNLIHLPNFEQVADTYSSQDPLIPTAKIMKKVEGKMIDIREISFHDLGHSYVQKRQDLWLFSTLHREPIELVKEWVRNKNWYVEACEKLKDADFSFYKAIQLYLFDIVHDRGYQFYLPILKQQIAATKNLRNLKTKIARGDFNDYPDKYTIDHIDRAQEWLLNKTSEFLIRDNREKLNKYDVKNAVVKHFAEIGTSNGVPVSVSFLKNGRIVVNFKSAESESLQEVSLYEIELLSIPVADSLLTPAYITKLNHLSTYINSNPNINKTQSDSFVLNGDMQTSLDWIQVEEHINTSALGLFDLKGIEIFKLERVLQLIKDKKSTNYSISKLPTTYIAIEQKGDSVKTACGKTFRLDEVSIEPKPNLTLKFINLNPHSRFISTQILRESYLRKPDSLYPDAQPYVSIGDMELGIVNTQYDVSIAKAVSSILSRSIETAKDTNGGYLPEKIVEAAQLNYVSPHAISNLWGRDGYRFVLSQKVNNEKREVIGTALISSSKDTLFFFTSKYNCIRHSTMTRDVNFDLKYDDMDHKWFDQFDMPPIYKYKIPEFNQLANFAVERTYRGVGLGKLLIREIIKNYVLIHPGSKITHSQPLICGKGLYQIADPSWKKYMMNIGFRLRYGADTFFTNPEWAPLEPVMLNGRMINHKEFNRKYDMPQIYDNWQQTKIPNPDFHILERIPHVITLATRGQAKLQYNQLYLPFEEYQID